MARKDHITGPAFLLVAGRTIGLIATFAIAPIFARLFTPDEMGTYKAFFLVYMTLFGLAQLGMAESLYYFIPRGAGRAGRYVCNAALMLLLAGAGSLAVLWTARARIADYFSNPVFAEYLPLLGVFLTCMLVGAVLEIMMVSRKQHMSAAVTYTLSEFARTALFILPAWLFVSLRAVFIGAALFAALRMTMMLAIVWRQFGREFRPDLAIWRSQLGYALPFALAVSVEVVLIYYHQYVVGGTFDPDTFAIYAIGVMSIPLFDLIMTSTSSVMMVKMAEHAGDREETLGLFHDTVSRLAFLLLPLAIGLAVLAHPFIITLYTPLYAASVPIFQIWVLAIIPGMLAVDAFLRVHAQTRFLLAMNLVRLAFVAGLIGWFLGAFGLVGAVLVTVAANVAAKALALGRIARILEVRLTAVLPWRTLGRLAARALAAAVPAGFLAHVFVDTPWLALVTGGAAYGAAYIVICYAPGLAEPAAIRLPIMARVRQLPIVGAFAARAARKRAAADLAAGL